MCLFSEAGEFKRIVSKRISGGFFLSGGGAGREKERVSCATARNLERRGELRTGLE